MLTCDVDVPRSVRHDESVPRLPRTSGGSCVCSARGLRGKVAELRGNPPMDFVFGGFTNYTFGVMIPGGDGVMEPTIRLEIGSHFLTRGGGGFGGGGGGGSSGSKLFVLDGFPSCTLRALYGRVVAMVPNDYHSIGLKWVS